MGTRELRTWVHGKGKIEDTVLRDANAFQERAHPSLSAVSPPAAIYRRYSFDGDTVMGTGSWLSLPGIRGIVILDET